MTKCFYYNNIMFIIVVAIIIISISRITTSNSIAPIPPLPSSPQHHSLYHRCNITRNNNNNINDNDNDNASTTTVTSTISDDDDTNVQIIRDSLRQEYPEIDTLLYSNRYIKLIMNVPGRSLLKCHEKIRNSLQWRRSYNVNKLRNAFIYTTTYQHQHQHHRVFEEDADVDNEDGIFIPLDQQNQNHNQTDNNYSYNLSSSSSFFIPTSELIEVCASGAFVIKRNKTIEVMIDDVDDVDINSKDDDEAEDHHVDDDQDHASNDKNDQKQKRGKRKETMLILYADTSRLNWWKTGVIAGLQYHVLVLEQALEQIRRRNHNTNNNDNNNIHKEEEDREVLSESIIVCVDTTNRRRRLRRNNGCNIRGSRNGRGRERERRNSWSRRNSSSSSYLPMPIPPPLSAIRGMVELMQKGYPTRIYRIYIGPIHPWLRRLYNYILPTMKPRSRKKIILLSEAPTNLDKLTGN